MKTLIPILWAILQFTALFSQSEICAINLLNGTRIASFANGESVELSFEYSTDEDSGVRIFARPFTNGSLTSAYAASGSPVYTGTGMATANFTISSGSVTVDEIRFQIFNTDQSELLKEFWVPVQYHFGDVGVHDFTFSEDQNLGSFLIGEQVDIGFEYDASNIGEGVRIFIRPFTDGNLTPGYGASGSPVFTGTGSQLVNFSINSGINVRVDALRVAVVSPDQNTTFQTFFVPVNWYWSTVKITDFNYGANNFFANGNNFNISYNYETTEANGVRIFPRPITNSNLTPGYGACGSALNTGNGTLSCGFTINEGNQRVDHIRFRALNPDQTTTLLELFLPVDLYFGSFRVANLRTCPPSPARLMPDEHVNFHYDLTNAESSSARAFTRPFTEGSLSSGYAASGSPAYPVGSTEVSEFYTLRVPGQVDQSRLSITNADQSQDWAAFFYAVDYNFSGAVTSIEPSLKAPEFLSWKLAPNPVREKAVFSISILQSHQLQIRLIDYHGRIVRNLTQRATLAGDQLNFDLDVRAWGLSSGIYFLQVQAESYSVVEPLVVQQ